MILNRHTLATFLLSAAVLAAAGCASDEPRPASNGPVASSRDLDVEVDATGIELEATAAGGTLRIVNTGKADLLVCDDNSCMPPLAPGNDLELPVSGSGVWHISALGDGEGRAEAHLTGGGDKASVKVK